MATGQKAEFFKLINATLDRRSALRVRFAYRMAKDAHRNQRRKSADANGDDRYFTHPREVARISMRYTMDPDLIIECLLHDVLEDGDDPLDAEEIEYFLGPNIVTTLRGVSKVPKEGFLERFVRYSNWRIRWVKACDRLHNMRTLPEDNPAFRAKQVKETVEVYLPLFEEMVDMVPPELRKGAAELVSEIRALCGGTDADPT